MPETENSRKSGPRTVDLTAMTGTLETSGTGGGVNESLKGVTNAVVELHGLPYRQGSVVRDDDNTGIPGDHGGKDARVASTGEEDSPEEFSSSTGREVLSMGQGPETPRTSKSPVKRAPARKTLSPRSSSTKKS